MDKVQGDGAGECQRREQLQQVKDSNGYNAHFADDQATPAPSMPFKALPPLPARLRPREAHPPPGYNYPPPHQCPPSLPPLSPQLPLCFTWHSVHAHTKIHVQLHRLRTTPLASSILFRIPFQCGNTNCNRTCIS